MKFANLHVLMEQAGGAGGQGGSGAGAAAGASATDWTTGFSDEQKGYIQNKGYKGPADLLDAYRNSESLIGKLTGASKDRLVALPEKDDDAEGWGKVYSKLGRPEKADDYKIDMPAVGGDETFAKWAKGTFHELGLSKKQAESLSAKWNEYVKGTQDASLKAQETKLEAEDLALKKEWGAAYDQHTNMAKQAAAAFGIDGPTIDKLEDAMGFAGVMKFLHGMGTKLGEDNFVSGDVKGGGFNGVMSPQAAVSRLETLKQDTDWVKKYLDGDASARSEMERLQRLAYPDAS